MAGSQRTNRDFNLGGGKAKSGYLIGGQGKVRRPSIMIGKKKSSHSPKHKKKWPAEQRRDHEGYTDPETGKAGEVRGNGRNGTGSIQGNRKGEKMK